MFVCIGNLICIFCLNFLSFCFSIDFDFGMSTKNFSLGIGFGLRKPKLWQTFSPNLISSNGLLHYNLYPKIICKANVTLFLNYLSEIQIKFFFSVSSSGRDSERLLRLHVLGHPRSLGGLGSLLDKVTKTFFDCIKIYFSGVYKQNQVVKDVGLNFIFVTWKKLFI